MPTNHVLMLAQTDHIKFKNGLTKLEDKITSCSASRYLCGCRPGMYSKFRSELDGLVKAHKKYLSEIKRVWPKERFEQVDADVKPVAQLLEFYKNNHNESCLRLQKT